MATPQQLLEIQNGIYATMTTNWFKALNPCIQLQIQGDKTIAPTAEKLNEAGNILNDAADLVGELYEQATKKP